MKPLIILLLFVSTFDVVAQESPFPFLLASSFDPSKHSLEDYYLSEKLDGVRAYWDGQTLSSRGGHRYAAPQWFTESLPEVALDGELWGGRQTFDEVSGIVRRIDPHDGWQKITFMVFDLPLASGDFSMRYQRMQQLHAEHYAKHLSDDRQYWRVVKQRESPKDLSSLQSMLIELDSKGGEGFMLKSKAAAYRAGRSDDLLKIKLKNDAEAIVIAHHKGKGRLASAMGSITVQMLDGTTFRIGSGFSDAQRSSPPQIGQTITFKYNGLTNNGKPRFPVFWRIREMQN